MEATMNNLNTKVKKPWSKKKKITVIILSALLIILIAAICTGVGVLNWYCKTNEYEIIQTNEDVTLIAHRGFRAVAPENTTASFEAAGEAQFWGSECDVYRTKDGVWVISHDIHTYRMMNENAFIEKITYDELMQMTVDNGSNIDDYPNLKFCSLNEYLDICQKYNMVAVIELKGKNNTEYYNEITDMVAEYDVDVVYISFHFENLQSIRKLSDAPVYYLVKAISEEDIELSQSIENCGIDFDASKEDNFNGILTECQEKNIPLCAWTVDDEETLNKLIGAGVTYITTDCIIY